MAFFLFLKQNIILDNENARVIKMQKKKPTKKSVKYFFTILLQNNPN